MDLWTCVNDSPLTKWPKRKLVVEKGKTRKRLLLAVLVAFLALVFYLWLLWDQERQYNSMYLIRLTYEETLLDKLRRWLGIVP
jgi:type II secretory pathway component PulM